MPLKLSGPWEPAPPADLISRVTQQFDASHADQARADFFVQAARHLRHHERALAALGREFSDFEAILDFGCGPGRLTRLLGELAPDVAVHGVDVDADLIAWATEHIPEATFAVGPHVPPLPYADGAFDLVLNHSVFTHLDEAHQDLWLAELQRVVRPGGLLLLTVHSTRQFNAALADMGVERERHRTEVERDGHSFIADDTFVGTTHPDWYHTAFHAPWYVFEHWTRWFTLRAFLPEGSDTQDLIVLERTAEADPLLEPIGHRAGAGEAAGEQGEPPTPTAAPMSYLPMLLAALQADDVDPPAHDALEAVTGGRAALADLRRTPPAGLRGRAAGRAADAGADPTAVEATVEAGYAGVVALIDGEQAGRRRDWMAMRALEELEARVIAQGRELHAELQARDRIIGVLRYALDEQAQRTAMALRDIRRDLAARPAADGRSDG